VEIGALLETNYGLGLRINKNVVSINDWPSGTVRGEIVCYLQLRHVHCGMRYFLLSTLL
jgi:hypothetical protein